MNTERTHSQHSPAPRPGAESHARATAASVSRRRSFEQLHRSHSSAVPFGAMPAHFTTEWACNEPVAFADPTPVSPSTLRPTPSRSAERARDPGRSASPPEQAN